jgi:hypothetical protein
LLLLAPPLDAVARQLRNEEATRVAGKLVRKYRVRQRFLMPLLHLARQRQMVHYELLTYEAAAATTHDQEEADAPDHPAADPHGKEPGLIRVTIVRSPGTFFRP